MTDLINRIEEAREDGRCECCDRPVNRKHGNLCGACIADDMDDWDDEPASDPDQVFLDFVCGMLPSGQCMLAGSEDCDWECPRGGMR